MFSVDNVSSNYPMLVLQFQQSEPKFAYLLEQLNRLLKEFCSHVSKKFFFFFFWNFIILIFSTSNDLLEIFTSQAHLHVKFPYVIIFISQFFYFETRIFSHY